MNEKSPQYLKINFDPSVFQTNGFHLPEQYQYLVAFLEPLIKDLNELSNPVEWTEKDVSEIGRAKSYVITGELENLFNDILSITENLEEILAEIKKDHSSLKKYETKIDEISERLRTNSQRFPKSYKYFEELANNLEKLLDNESNAITIVEEILKTLPVAAITSTKQKAAILNIGVMKESLEHLGIKDDKLQDLVLSLVIQHRIGWAVSIGGLLGQLCSVVYNNKTNTNTGLYRDQFGTAGETVHLDLTYDKKTEQISYVVTLVIKYTDGSWGSKNEPIPFAHLRSELLIDKNGNITFKENAVTIDIDPNKVDKWPQKLKLFPKLLAEEASLFKKAAHVNQAPSPNKRASTKNEITRSTDTTINTTSSKNEPSIITTLPPTVIPLSDNENIFTKLKNFIKANPWKTAALIFSAVSFVVGIILVASGVGSPLGAALAAGGIKLAVSAGASAVLSGISLAGVSAIATGIAAAAHKAFQVTKAKISNPFSSIEKYIRLDDQIDTQQNAVSPINEQNNIQEPTVVVSKQANVQSGSDLPKHTTIEDEIANNNELPKQETKVSSSEKPSLIKEYIFTPSGLHATEAKLMQANYDTRSYHKKDLTMYAKVLKDLNESSPTQKEAIKETKESVDQATTPSAEQFEKIFASKGKKRQPLTKVFSKLDIPHVHESNKNSNLK